MDWWLMVGYLALLSVLILSLVKIELPELRSPHCSLFFDTCWIIGCQDVAPECPETFPTLTEVYSGVFMGVQPAHWPTGP